MKEILELIVKNLVEDVNSIKIQEIIKENSTVFQVKVSPEDMGKIIGKQGRIAKAIRLVMKSIASKEKKRIIVEFID